MRAALRAIEMSPDLARQQNNSLSQRKAVESQEVMERTESTANNPGSIGGVTGENSNRMELRAISQRLERMLRERREADESRYRKQGVPSK